MMHLLVNEAGSMKRDDAVGGGSSPTVAAAERKSKRRRKASDLSDYNDYPPRKQDESSISRHNGLASSSARQLPPRPKGKRCNAATQPTHVSNKKGKRCNTPLAATEPTHDGDVSNKKRATFAKVLAGQATKSILSPRSSPGMKVGKKASTKQVSWRPTFEHFEFNSPRSLRTTGAVPSRHTRGVTKENSEVPSVVPPSPFCQCAGGNCLEATCACYLSGIGCVLPGCSCSLDAPCCTDNRSKQPAESRYMYNLEQISKFRKSKLSSQLATETDNVTSETVQSLGTWTSSHSENLVHTGRSNDPDVHTKPEQDSTKAVTPNLHKENEAVSCVTSTTKLSKENNNEQGSKAVTSTPNLNKGNEGSGETVACAVVYKENDNNNISIPVIGHVEVHDCGNWLPK